MVDQPKPAAHYRDTPNLPDGTKPRPLLLRDLTPLEQMYAYFGADRA